MVFSSNVVDGNLGRLCLLQRCKACSLSWSCSRIHSCTLLRWPCLSLIPSVRVRVPYIQDSLCVYIIPWQIP